MAVFVELCAGSAILSSEASKRGFQTFAIDHEMNRFTPKSKIFVLDLSKDSSQHLLSDMYRQMRPQWTHMGLPCGTASRAREKPVSVHGAPRPRPLRDQNNLLGLDNLTASEQSRVDGANRVYRTAEHVLFQIFPFGPLGIIGKSRALMVVGHSGYACEAARQFGIYCLVFSFGGHHI